MNLSRSTGLSLLLLGVSLGTFSRAQDQAKGDPLGRLFCGEDSRALGSDDFPQSSLDLYAVSFGGPTPGDFAPINKMWNDCYDWLM